MEPFYSKTPRLPPVATYMDAAGVLLLGHRSAAVLLIYAIHGQCCHMERRFYTYIYIYMGSL